MRESGIAYPRSLLQINNEKTPNLSIYFLEKKCKANLRYSNPVSHIHEVSQLKKFSCSIAYTLA